MSYQRSPRGHLSQADQRITSTTKFEHNAVRGVNTVEQMPLSYRAASRFSVNLTQIPRGSTVQKRDDAAHATPYKITAPKPSPSASQEIKAVAGSEQVGTVRIRGLSQHKLEIADLSVAPQYQQQGISKSLLSAAMAEGKKQGYSTGQLGVQPKSPDMDQATLTGIYARQGFKSTHRKLNGVPAMARKL